MGEQSICLGIYEMFLDASISTAKWFRGSVPVDVMAVKITCKYYMIGIGAAGLFVIFSNVLLSSLSAVWLRWGMEKSRQANVCSA